jgi:hypothetical protein
MGYLPSFCVSHFTTLADTVVVAVVATKALGSKKATKLKSHTHFACICTKEIMRASESCLKYEN